jgi:hypothetical protein
MALTVPVRTISQTLSVLLSSIAAGQNTMPRAHQRRVELLREHRRLRRQHPPGDEERVECDSAEHTEFRKGV